jgi:hypothetical protein
MRWESWEDDHEWLVVKDLDEGDYGWHEGTCISLKRPERTTKQLSQDNQWHHQQSTSLDSCHYADLPQPTTVCMFSESTNGRNNLLIFR